MIDPPFSNIEFYKELETNLLASTASIRNEWVRVILENQVDIKYLSNLLKLDKKIALRFLWLLSDIGVANPNRLLMELPWLLKLSDQKEYIDFKIAFVSYWLITGVPVENESAAIDLLFEWVLSNKTSKTTKSRSFKVLFKLVKKYPELKNELEVCLNDQMLKHSKNFEKKTRSMLTELALL